jgi:hypothetical protein
VPYVDLFREDYEKLELLESETVENYTATIQSAVDEFLEDCQNISTVDDYVSKDITLTTPSQTIDPDTITISLRGSFTSKNSSIVSFSGELESPEKPHKAEEVVRSVVNALDDCRNFEVTGRPGQTVFINATLHL